ncbi:MAG TPA: thioredoxin-like domain-containing protein [Bacteroidales bacterium]|nr:thioredoxin-like domain-containing protein [Bacteroidales bacterium]
MMKKIITLLFVFLLVPPAVFGQGLKIPPFKIMREDGSLFRAQDLPMGKPVIIIYFSPECEDCQKFTEGLISHIDDFWDASIVMVTYLSVQSVADYVKKFKLNIYPNIYAGTEGNAFIVRYYYNVRRFPFVALLDKDGNLVKIWNKEENIEELITRLKALKK